MEMNLKKISDEDLYELLEESYAEWRLATTEGKANEAWNQRGECQVELARRTAALQKENDELAEALEWYVKEDDTGDDRESNAYWFEGKERAQKILAGRKERLKITQKG